ncbi:type I-E CRISPR-associated protein Cse1/CasA [Amycolatopsis sp. EV170708-02-1]|uniref:type I-E CRISPR-associated protein Cse1/CasA n=1 Tax=Amycolatopsis sp. EV170708-02-1 TaxID=2919322 RepID=UPI001F0CA3A5|nr:type I-E CRISPR-associated protein Cse1/CasA [Amycolatopsis sp. EV170708-02-1]UMP07062.1 type I-E CRISPR-associated protein Cse1/CasA [Amycolatopsis sp. EV170708-02-1]
MTTPFDLSVEPWIPVVRLDGTREDVSLHDVLLQAHEIRRIVGETPPMTAALYRLLLALLHRVYGPARRGDWGELWSAKAFSVAPLDRHLEAHEFDLFHPEVPFLQCPALPEEKGSTVAKLIPHKSVGNNATLFDHTVVSDRVEVSPTAAARWLVTAQAFDPGGMKTPYEKDKSSERAPCSSLGVVLLEGRTLKETLLLNAVSYDPQAEKPPMTTMEDAPAWERGAPLPTPGSRDPLGWTDLLTWPSRRIRLIPEVVDGEQIVTRVVLTPGVRLKGSLPDLEIMAAFRTPRAVNGKIKPGTPMLPIRLHPVRGVWRHSVELLLHDPREEERTRQRPRALKQIADLTEAGYIPDDTVYTLRVFGQKLDKNASVVEGYLEEEVPAPVALIRATDKELAGLIGTAIELADEAGAALRGMQREYHKDMRAEPDVTLDLAYWPALARPFEVFLRAVNTARLQGASERSAVTAWRRAVLRIAEGAAETWTAGVAASDRNLSMLGKQHAVFRNRLSKIARVFDARAAKYLTRDETE